jgi:hypothetical protein
LERIWKEAVVDKYKVLLYNNICLEGLKKHEKPQGTRSEDQDMNPVPSEYGAES